MTYEPMTYAHITRGRLAIPLACINCIQINMTTQSRQYGQVELNATVPLTLTIYDNYKPILYY